jgi:3D (Asp-Asp-Asp) domain-containing protein
MSRIYLILIAPLVAACFSSCATTEGSKAYAATPSNSNIEVRKAGSCLYKVKTTAYCHTEKDSLRYGRGTATGNLLKYGQVRSAAADWSVFPVGTIFRIVGEKAFYQVDDYGRALVGTKTIDLYRPDSNAMADWGTRNVNIEVLRWGSYTKSLDILQERQQRHPHVQMMVTNILKKTKHGS